MFLQLLKQRSKSLVAKFTDVVDYLQSGLGVADIDVVLNK